jgi:TolB-like protein
MSERRSFFAELKRRNVYKVAIAYAVVAWLLIQVATQTFPFFDVPNWAVRLVILLLIIGFPISLIMAWAFELTPEGIKRSDEVPPTASVTRATGRKLDFIIIGVLALAVALLVFDRFRPKPQRQEGSKSEKAIAVLPFENLSRDPENAYFADGVQDEILTYLSKIGDLKVISRSSVMHYKSGVERNLRKIAGELGVAHIVEGSVQRAGAKVRVNAQLIDARSDAHLWANTYDRDLADVFAIQSEIAKAVAEQLQAKLSPSEKKAIDRAPTEDLVAFDLYTRAKDLILLASNSGTTKADLLRAIELLNEAVTRDRAFFDAYC